MEEPGALDRALITTFRLGGGLHDHQDKIDPYFCRITGSLHPFQPEVNGQKGLATSHRQALLS